MSITKLSQGSIGVFCNAKTVWFPAFTDKIYQPTAVVT